jgi:hypothetical protein
MTEYRRGPELLASMLDMKAYLKSDKGLASIKLHELHDWRRVLMRCLRVLIKRFLSFTQSQEAQALQRSVVIEIQHLYSKLQPLNHEIYHRSRLQAQAQAQGQKP